MTTMTEFRDANGNLLGIAADDEAMKLAALQAMPGAIAAERDGTFDEQLAQCYRQRQAAYDSRIPAGAQFDADYHARHGDTGPQQVIDAIREAIKAEFPKPTPPQAS